MADISSVEELLREMEELQRQLVAPCERLRNPLPGEPPALATWLQDTTGHRVVVSGTDQTATPGTVYRAPDDNPGALLRQQRRDSG